MEFKITNKNQLLMFWPTALVLAGYGAILLFAKYNYDQQGLDYAFKFSSIAFLIYFVLQVLIHYKYYLMNWNVVFKAKIKPQRFEIEVNNVSFVFSKDAVEKVIVIKSLATYRKSFRFLPIDDYFFMKIKLKSGEEFIITTLIDHELAIVKQLFDTAKIEENPSFIAWPPQHVLTKSQAN